MAYQSKDGHSFPTMSRQRLYEESAGNLKRPGMPDAYKGAGAKPGSMKPGSTAAAGGQDHRQAVADHGPAKRVTISRDDAGQHHIDAEMGDGSPYSSTHSDAGEAQDTMRALMGGGGSSENMSGDYAAMSQT